jgi:type II restriction/modification system DNA methylase subunit YeeA
MEKLDANGEIRRARAFPRSMRTARRQEAPESDPHGTEYTFEKATLKFGGASGYADVWKKGCFAWEYKGPKKNLVQAYAQLKGYADALDNPPLLIVSDMREIRVHTNFTNTIAQQHVFALPDLVAPETRNILRACFLAPERLRPNETREGVTAKAATRFANIAVRLRHQNHDPQRIAHFLNKLVFCLFVEDIDLLPKRVFADILDEAVKEPDAFPSMLGDLFGAMAKRNGRFGAVTIPWFNGGLFDDDEVLPVSEIEIRDLVGAARLDWSAIDPTIFGTLFESGLDDKKRREMASLFDLETAEKPTQPRLFDGAAPNKGVGIHYTDPATIMKIIEPVVLRPLRVEWEDIKAELRSLSDRRARAKSERERASLVQKSRGLYGDFRQRLGKFRVLDPACGSGNFLALALGALKDFDLAIIREAAELELPPDDQRVGPQAVLGIEVNPYAAELARLTVWITELQWQLRNAFGIKRSPILGSLDGIACRDALINRDGTEASWPEADVVVGNPPFLGNKRMITALGEEYVGKLRGAYEGQVPAGIDLVAYWVAKAWRRMKDGRTLRAGLVTTNSIRAGANRRVLEAITGGGTIFDAWADEPWIIDGVAVRVSLLCFAAENNALPIHLDGESVKRINSDLTATQLDLTTAEQLPENSGVAFQGPVKVGSFDIPGEQARIWLRMPKNPNGRPNHDVLRPWMNGMDITRRPSDTWIIDFDQLSERDACLYEAPFQHVVRCVKPKRDLNRDAGRREHWWRLGRSGADFKAAVAPLSRYIGTPRVAKHRIFVWLHSTVIADARSVAIALHTCSWHGVGNDPTYNGESVFGTFPLPEGLTPNIPAAAYANDPRAAAIAAAAKRLDELREAWLNPPDLVRREPEVVPGFPDRLLSVDATAATILKTRTLTNLYNERPAWLANAHRDLDAAVAYGWPADIAEDDALARLLELNKVRAGATPPAAGAKRPATKGRAARPNAP